ncbi:restriction endonuclease subunit S [Prevotella sp.]|uniref:restriction endonuclease subunit S n=1 Tax=Prevotella sp. TaxID=59823 RepID=UPI00307BCEB5
MKQGWEYKKLGEVCHITMGQSPDGKSINDNEGVEFHQGKTCFGERTLGVSILFSNAPVKLAEAHSVLLCVRAPVGYPNITNRKICIGRGLCALYAKKDIDNTFLFYSLLGKQSHFEKNATGSTFKAISSKVISNTEIPLPPKSIQLAIVSELDKINELIRLKKEQLKDYDNLTQSIFYEMFGDPVENEKGWEVKKIGDVCTDIRYGTSKPACENGCYKYLRMCNITDDGFLNLSNLKTIDIPDDEIEKCIVRHGDILFNRTNSIELVGKTCMFDNSEPMVIAGYIIRVRLNERLLPVVLARMFNLVSIKKKLRSIAKGAVNQANINSKELASIRIPLPPLPLQHLFAQRIEQIERQKSAVQKSITDLETLLASRMQYWFE